LHDPDEGKKRGEPNQPIRKKKEKGRHPLRDEQSSQAKSSRPSVSKEIEKLGTRQNSKEKKKHRSGAAEWGEKNERKKKLT